MALLLAFHVELRPSNFYLPLNLEYFKVELP